MAFELLNHLLQIFCVNFLEHLSFKTTRATWQFGLKVHFTNIWSPTGITLGMLATCVSCVLKLSISSFCLFLSLSYLSLDNLRLCINYIGGLHATLIHITSDVPQGAL